MVQLIKIASGQGEPRSHAIFLHGLGGDLYGTWRSGDDPRSFWPRWLAEDIESLAVYLLGYEAPISRWRGAAMHLPDRATNLLARLLAERELQQGKLILIGHSLGGLVIKQLLRTADSEAPHRTDAADLIARVEKVVFLGTPHTGSGLATLTDRLRTLVRPSAATTCLVRNDPHLHDLNLWYRDWTNARGISHLTLTETKSIRILGMIVKPDSSDPGLVGSRPVPIDADHWTVCKPTDRTSDIYINIRAFIERTIERTTASEVVSAVSKPDARKIFYGVPPRIAHFTGRIDDLQQIEAILMRDKPAAVTQAAVQGMGGIGKTSLAIEYAHRYRDLYAGVCWCPAQARTGLLSALAGLAVTLGAARADEADVEKSAKAALGRLAEQRATWLLVYDNVTSPDEIADLLPSAGARVLITSRFSDWGGLAAEVALDMLPLEEAVAFLQSRTGRSDRSGAKTLAEALGRLPLALDHGAAYCKRTQMRFADYATKASSLIDAVPRGTGYPRSVAATFDLAITEAVAQSQAAEALMAYLAQCAPERVPMTLVEGAVEDEVERMKALATLAEVSLVKHEPFEDGTPAWTVHRLVQAVARARSEANGSAQHAVGLLISRLVAIYPEQHNDDPQSWPLCAQLTPHLLALRPGDVSVVAAWPLLLERVGGYFYWRAAYQGDFAGAQPLFERALAICEKTLGPEHPQTALTLNNLARLLMDQGDFTRARSLLERALAINEKTLGPEHPDTATKMSDLARVLRATGHANEAEPLFRKAIATGEKALGRYNLLTQRYASHYARLLLETGRAMEGLTMAQFALATHEAATRQNHPWTKDSARVTADALDALGRTEEAKALRERYGVTGSDDPRSS